jgi:hypothetical protein
MDTAAERISSRLVPALCAGALVALLASAPAAAKAPPREGTVYLHSAARGELDGGRLTLHGVSRRLTWAHHSGRSGVMSVKRMHRRIFSADTPEATGMLHVAGHHGGDELTFTLSRPRYDRARRTVSYRAKPLNDGELPGSAARAAQKAGSFGAASLTIQAAPPASLDVEQSTYPCPQDSSTTCWGTLEGSGLPAGSDVTGFAPQVPGNTGQGEEIDARVDGFGNVNVQLNLLCNNDYHVTHPNISIDQTSVTPSFEVDAPDSCG